MLFGESPWSSAEILALVARLPEGSMYISQRHDAEHWRYYLDIDQAYYLGAGLFNALNENTRATGQWKKAPPKMKPWPLPDTLVKTYEAKKKGPKTLDDLYAMLTGGAIMNTERARIE